MAALNLAHELRVAEINKREIEGHLADSIAKMTHKIEIVLDNAETR